MTGLLPRREINTWRISDFVLNCEHYNKNIGKTCHFCGSNGPGITTFEFNENVVCRCCWGSLVNYRKPNKNCKCAFH